MLICKRLPLSATPNARDLGGLPLPGGGATRWGVFYRAAVPDSLTPGDIALCRARNLTHVIDLRAAGQPNPFADVPGIELHRFPLVDVEQVPDDDNSVPQAYMVMAGNYPAMRGIFQVLAEAEGACLYHCFAGKDRTGTVTALLLLLAGVDDVDIIADYAVSYAYILERTQAKADELGLPPTPYLEDLCWMASRPEFMIEFLGLFREKYGTAENYMKEIGLTDSRIQRLRAKLCE